jgi:hypothetical protein
MDERIQIWNHLHDGEITAVAEDGDTLTMFVSIPYLRRRLKPLGDSFVLTLSGVRQAECRDFVGAISSLGEEFDIGTPEILQTKSEFVPVTIDTTMGQLILDFQTIRFALDTGQSVDYKTIAKASEDYWTESRTKTAQAPTDTSG